MKTSTPTTLVPLEIRNHSAAWEQMTESLQGREAFHSQFNGRSTLQKASTAISESCITVRLQYLFDVVLGLLTLPLLHIYHRQLSTILGVREQHPKTNLLIFIARHRAFLAGFLDWHHQIQVTNTDEEQHTWCSMRCPACLGLRSLPPPWNHPPPEPVSHNLERPIRHVSQFPLKRCSKQEPRTNKYLYTILSYFLPTIPRVKKQRYK